MSDPNDAARLVIGCDDPCATRRTPSSGWSEGICRRQDQVFTRIKAGTRTKASGLKKAVPGL
jgi:hypothetical protein